MKIGLAIVSACFWLLPLAASAAPILHVDGSRILHGASGVDVNGTLYDVEFVGGTCIELFDGCDQSADFTFSTSLDVLFASNALMTQVFADNAMGNFDSDPTLTEGCSGVTRLGGCNIFTAYQVFGSSVYTIHLTNRNDLIPAPDDVIDNFSVFDSTVDTGDSGSAVWAKWTPTAVPEPGTISLLVWGLVSMGLYRSRREAPLKLSRRSLPDMRFHRNVRG